MRPEFQRDIWSLGIGAAALAAVMLSGVLHKAGAPARDVIGVAITFAIATGLTLMIAELLDRLSRRDGRRAASARLDSRKLGETGSQRSVETSSQREQQRHAHDQGGAAQRDHDD
jgi:hypothetical protein